MTLRGAPPPPTTHPPPPPAQALYRQKRARRRVRDLAASVYVKVKDPGSGNYYYFNVQSQASSWTKPAALGALEILETKY